jgi:hypothetical protein
LDFACSCFSRRCSIGSLIWDCSTLLIYALMVINLPLRTALALFHRFWYVLFSLLLTSWNLLISSFISSMTHWSLCHVLFSF